MLLNKDLKWLEWKLKCGLAREVDIKMRIKEYLQQLCNGIQENEITARGAQLSYFFILSIFPFLIFLITLLDYTPLTKQESVEQLSLLLPETAFAIVTQIISEVATTDNFTLFSFGILATIWIASRGLSALIKSINKAYNITESRSFIKMNALAVLATFAMALVILFTLSFLVFGKVIGELAFQHLGLEEVFHVLWSILRYAIPLLIISASFTFLFLYSPNYRLSLKHVYPGAIFSTLAWITTSQAFAFYVNNFGNYSRIYGSIGGIIVFMIWFYISSVVVLLGGEINATLYNTFYKINL